MDYSSNGSVKFYVFPVLGNLMVSVGTRSFCMIFSFTEMYFLDQVGEQKKKKKLKEFLNAYLRKQSTLSGEIQIIWCLETN